MFKYCILLTACINPNGMSKTALNDKVIRQQQYIDAINFYLLNTKQLIVFCENSGSDISKYFEQNNRLEFLTFNGNDYDKSIGKSFGEAKIIEYAINKSVFLSKCDYIIKVTGRLKFKNINKFILNHQIIPPKNISLMNICPQEAFCDSRLFIMSTSLIRDFLQNYHQINESIGIDFERVLMHFLNYTKKGYTLVPVIEPICNEICGTTGMAYPCSKNTIFFKVKYFICQSLYNFKLIKWYLKGNKNNFIDFKKNINIEIK